MIAADAGSLSLGGELTVVNYVERLEEAKAALREGRLALSGLVSLYGVTDLLKIS